MRFAPTPALAAVLASVTCNAARAAEPGPDPKGVEFFEAKIRPVLVEHCYPCHSADAARAGKLKAGLALDTRAGLRKGGESGPAVVPGKPAESLLVKSLRHGSDVPAMPPKRKLPAAVIADFEAWVEMGTPDPRGGSAAAARRGMTLEEGRRF